MKGVLDLVLAVGLWHEYAAFRYCACGGNDGARGQDDFDQRSRMQAASLRPFIEPGISVSVNDTDVRSRFQNPHGVCGVMSFERRIACVFHHLDGVLWDEALVLDNE